MMSFGFSDVAPTLLIMTSSEGEHGRLLLFAVRSLLAHGDGRRVFLLLLLLLPCGMGLHYKLCGAWAASM